MGMMGTLLIKLNYSLLFWAILCNVLEMADVETPNNRATPANDIPNSFTNRPVISSSQPAIFKYLDGSILF
jgi:hypothetical protein